MNSSNTQLDAILGEYIEAAELGNAPSAAEWIARHPKFEPQLREFLALNAGLARISAPIREGLADNREPTTDHRQLSSDNQQFPIAFGRYELLEELGHGGMGVVYRARQEGLEREVALKMIHSGRFASEALRHRFRVEAIAVGRLNHPAIVPVYDVGEADGQPYYTMKLLTGGDLAACQTVKRIEPTAAARIVEQLAEAIEHAHQHGVLHRDLKPSNVLFDDGGKPYLSDFGLAKLLGEPNELTRTGEYLGTPAYFAPELARGDEGATTAADIYGLGAILYFALAGAPPFAGSSTIEILDAVRVKEPPRLRSVIARVPVDLETICQRCMEKEPRQRYESARALADELRRWLDGRPIASRPSGWFEGSAKWARRAPTLAALVAVCVMATLAGIAGAVWHFERVRAELAVSDRLRIKGHDREVLLRQQVYVADMESAKRALDGGEADELGELLDRYLPGSTDAEAALPDVRGWEWHYLQRVRAQKPTNLWQGHATGILWAEIDPDERWLATCARDGTIKIWHVATSKLLAEFARDGEATCIRFSPDGKLLASCGRGGSVELWDTATWTKAAELPCHQSTVTSVDFAPNGKLLATSGRDGYVTIWDFATRQIIRRIRTASDVATHVEWSPDGNQLASCGSGGTIELWAASTGTRVHHLRCPFDATLLCVAYSPDGVVVLACGYDHRMVRFETATGKPLPLFANGASNCVRIDRQGRLFTPISANLMTVFSIHNADAALRRLRTLAAGVDKLRCVSIAERIGRLWLVSESGRIEEWSLSDVLASESHAVPAAVFAIDRRGDRFVSANGDTLEVRTADAVIARVVAKCSVVSAAMSPDGRRLAFSQTDGTFTVWNLDAHRLLSSRSDTIAARRIAFDRAGELVATADGKRAKIVRAADQTVLHEAAGVDVAFAPRGGQFAVASNEPLRISVIDLGTQTERCSIEPTGFVDKIAIAFDGELLAGICWDAALEYWICSTGKFVGRRSDPWTPASTDLAFAPDGRTIATRASNGPLKLWNVATRRELFTLHDLCRGAGGGLHFSPDGALVLLERPAANTTRLVRWKLNGSNDHP